jgi:hypothetical protein
VLNWGSNGEKSHVEFLSIASRFCFSIALLCIAEQGEWVMAKLEDISHRPALPSILGVLLDFLTALKAVGPTKSATQAKRRSTWCLEGAC